MEEILHNLLMKKLFGIRAKFPESPAVNNELFTIFFYLIFLLKIFHVVILSVDTKGALFKEKTLIILHSYRIVKYIYFENKISLPLSKYINRNF